MKIPYLFRFLSATIPNHSKHKAISILLLTAKNSAILWRNLRAPLFYYCLNCKTFNVLYSFAFAENFPNYFRKFGIYASVACKAMPKLKAFDS